MTTDEAARLHLYARAQSALDDDAARTLMTALPWDVAELATKQDLLILKQDLVILKKDVIASTLRGVFVMNIAIATVGIALAELVR